MEPVRRFELLTLALQVRCSGQLSYTGSLSTSLKNDIKQSIKRLQAHEKFSRRASRVGDCLAALLS